MPFLGNLAKGKVYKTLSTLFATDFRFGNCIEVKCFIDENIFRMSVKISKSRSIFSHCRPLSFLSLPYLVGSGNAKRMLHIYTSGEISVSLFCQWIFCDERLTKKQVLLYVSFRVIYVTSLIIQTYCNESLRRLTTSMKYRTNAQRGKCPC